ncbi:MAG: hypothetical protein ACW96X_10290, partial [Promethearchaeota archaeon]
MHSYKTLEPNQVYMKKKVCILGGYENYKDEFQKRISSNCLPIENKHNIGVNISKIDYFYKFNHKFEFLLWNIDCSQNRAFLRRTFYSGADAIIIFVSEDKVNQIKQYFDEIQTISPDIFLVFCVILENLSQKDIVRLYFNSEEFISTILDFNIKTYEISNQSEIFNQLSSMLLKRIQEKESERKIIINFIHLDSLFGHSAIRDDCNDYYEPETNNSISNQQLVNLDLLNIYIQSLELDIKYESLNWVKIANKNFGSFSIYIKNGEVYYFPEICEKCGNKKCSKFSNAPYFVCIEAGESSGWTNIKGFNQNELLILAKIIALKEGTEKNLPNSVLKQIKNINQCERRR